MLQLEGSGSSRLGVSSARGADLPSVSLSFLLREVEMRTVPLRIKNIPAVRLAHSQYPMMRGDGGPVPSPRGWSDKGGKGARLLPQGTQGPTRPRMRPGTPGHQVEILGPSPPLPPVGSPPHPHSSPSPCPSPTPDLSAFGGDPAWLASSTFSESGGALRAWPRPGPPGLGGVCL